MPQVTGEEVSRALREAGLEGAGKDTVFPWGAKIVEVEGRKMLQPFTPEEYRQNVREETGRELTDEEVMTPRCVYTTANCVSQGCSGSGRYCSMHYSNGGWYCLCNY